METMKETLEQFDKRIKKERATEKYNDRMRNRLQKGSPGKPHKSHRKKPQVRKSSTKVNKGETFVKLSKRKRKILKRGH